MTEERFRYWAFISYSHLDQKYASWLHRALETYRVPGNFVGRKTRIGEIPKRLYPVFRDREELPTSADLGENIRSALRQSRFLIVVCSPHSAKSLWVNEEIKTFKAMGRESYVLLLIVDGEPNASDKPGIIAQECFAPALRFGIDAKGEPTSERTEPIAADTRPDKDGKRNALLKLIAGLLGIDYAILNDREKKRRIRKLMLYALVFLVLATAVTAVTYNVRTERGSLLTRLDESERMIKQLLDERLLDSEGRPIALQLTEDLRSRAEELIEKGNKKQQMIAAISIGDFALADKLYAEIEALTEAERAIEDFELLTLLGDRYYWAGEFDQAIEPFEKALALRPDDVQARNNLAVAYSQDRFGDIAENQVHAIEIYEGSLQLVPATSYQWAMIQGNLGVAWSNMPVGNRAENLTRSIAAYEAALTVFTREAYPLDWAMTLNNLGNSYVKMPTGDLAENLCKAITAFEDVLTLRTKENNPYGWANTQANLAIARSQTPDGHLVALVGFDAALTVFTKEAYPDDWARVQNNVGVVWLYMSVGDRAENIKNAIAAFRNALEIDTVEHNPVGWAKTCSNLGYALVVNPESQHEDFENAITIFSGVFAILTRDTHPFEWAGSHLNMALAFWGFSEGAGTRQVESLRLAIANAKAAQSVFTSNAYPHEYDQLMKMFQLLREAYDTTDGGQTMPLDMIPPVEY